MTRRKLLMLSGGLDSTLLLHQMVEEKTPVIAVSFDYGQKHVKEIQYARWHCKVLKVEHIVEKIGRLHGSSLVGEPGNCIVPVRNATLLTFACNIAAARSIARVVIGCCKTDATFFPDCRRAFVDAFNKMLGESYASVVVEAPLLAFNKASLLYQAREFRIKSSTVWWCYKGGKKPCGKCKACLAIGLR